MGTVVVLLVVGARLVAPLAIPRYPLPGILASLVLDAVDQTVFQQVDGLDIDGYQQYDKALDVYYLTIAYLSTLQNWSDPFAFGIARFLFYYRLAGVVAFEATDARWLLLAFPNTFEYFFIAYELVRCRWAPTRMRPAVLAAAAAAIWVVIKLPQEWWLHIAELDVTDEIKTTVLGGSMSESWWSAIAGRPWLSAALALAIVLVACAIAAAARRLPPGDWPFGVRVSERTRGGHLDVVPASWRMRQSAFVRGPLIEKIVLVSMVFAVFAQIVPGVRASLPQIMITVTVLVVVNSLASHWVAGRGAEWTSTVSQFVYVGAVNTAAIVVLTLLPGPAGPWVQPIPALFYLLLITLIVTLYDRYRMLRALRRRKPFPLWPARRRLLVSARVSGGREAS